jgi:hypothetical protein
MVTSQDPQLVASALKVQPKEDLVMSEGPAVLELPAADSPGTPWSRRQQQLEQGKVSPQSLSDRVTITLQGDAAEAEAEAPTRC